MPAVKPYTPPPLKRFFTKPCRPRVFRGRSAASSRRPCGAGADCSCKLHAPGLWQKRTLAFASFLFTVPGSAPCKTREREGGSGARLFCHVCSGDLQLCDPMFQEKERLAGETQRLMQEPRLTGTAAATAPLECQDNSRLAAQNFSLLEAPRSTRIFFFCD